MLYLIFNEGYASSFGAHLQRLDLAGEAIRLARASKALLPEDAEITGLLALMLLTDARRAARTGIDEALIPLGQARSNLVGPSRDLRRHRTPHRRAIKRIRSACISYRRLSLPFMMRPHERRTRIGHRFWRLRVAEAMSPSPMVTLNHAIAAAMVHGPSKGLELLGRLITIVGLPVIIGCMPFAPTCWRCLATMKTPSNTTELQPDGQRVSRNRITS